MTLPTPETLREAVAKVKARIEQSVARDYGGVGMTLEEADTLVKAADLLLSEEWQGMVEAYRYRHDDYSRKGAIVFKRAALSLARKSLARKLAAQEHEK